MYSSQVVDTGLITSSQRLVLSELRSLLVWLGLQLSVLSPQHAEALLNAPFQV